MKTRGFTLIELLGVIILIALLMTLAFPTVINFIKSSNEKVNELNSELIYNAAQSYVSNNKNKFPKVDGNSYCITFKELVEIGNLKSPINIDGNDATDLSSVQVTYENGYKYKIVDKDSCIESVPLICKAVDSSTKTTGNIPTGTFNTGDEYICDVDGTHEYHFFVLSADVNNVNLILDRNITSTGLLASTDDLGTIAWITKSDYISSGGSSDSYGSSGNSNKGPVTAMNFAHNATSSWSNIPNININYTDEGSKYGGLVTNNDTTSIIDSSGNVSASYSNLKVRLPKESELTQAGCNDSKNSCPLWLDNYLNYANGVTGGTNIAGIYRYWTLSSTSSNAAKARAIIYNGYIGDMEVFRPSASGIRPVISIPKGTLK